jgi:hypothetical protein
MLIKKDYLITEVQEVENPGSYVELRKTMVFSLLLFKLKKSNVMLFNEVITISGEQMERLSKHVFSHFLDVTVKMFYVMDFIYRSKDHFFINAR